MNIEVFSDSIRARSAILHFSGWPDAGGLVERTINELKTALSCKKAAVWGLDHYWRIDAYRPHVQVRNGQIKSLEWPEFAFFECSRPSGEPFLIGSGPEPASFWGAFSVELLRQLKAWGCHEVFLLGSMLDEVLHDETIVSCIVQDERGWNMAVEAGCELTDYEGPAAIHSAVMQAAESEGVRCLSLWAHLPFYLNEPSELVAAHFLRTVGRMLGFKPNVSHLVAAWKERRARIESSIEENGELSQTLEAMKQRKREPWPEHRPAAKIVRMEEYLRRRHDHAPHLEPEDDEGEEAQEMNKLTPEQESIFNYTIDHFKEVSRQNRFPENNIIDHDESRCAVCHPELVPIEPFVIYLEVVTQAVKMRRPSVDDDFVEMMNSDLAAMGEETRVSRESLLAGEEEAVEAWKEWARDALATGLGLLSIHGPEKRAFDLDDAEDEGMGELIESKIGEVMAAQKKNSL